MPSTTIGEIALAIEKKLEMFQRLSKVPVVILRAFSIYGPNEDSFGPSATVTGIFRYRSQLKKPLYIEGDGSNIRDFIHVDDVVSGIILAAQTSDSNNQVINLGTGKAFNILDVAEMTYSSPIHVPARQKDLGFSLANINRMKSILGLKLNHSFSDSYPKIVRNNSYSLRMDANKWITNVDIELAPWLLNSGYI